MDVTSAKIVELRVHGVSGTPPEEMLETHHARQEAGDEYSRFFVAVDCFGDKPPDPVEDGKGPHVRSTRLEGFHWGRYTSGNWRQALWLALVPFGMVNAAQFMLSPPSTWRERFFHTVVGGALRLLAFGLTATFALAASSISIDLVARQRLATTRLGRGAGGGHAPGGAARWSRPGGVLVLYRLGRRNTTVREPPDAADTLGRSLGDTSGLTRENFYAGDPDATSLGRLHLAGGWATVALVGSLTDGDAQLGAPAWARSCTPPARAAGGPRRAGGGARRPRAQRSPVVGARLGAGELEPGPPATGGGPDGRVPRAGGPAVVGGHAVAARGEPRQPARRRGRGVQHARGGPDGHAARPLRRLRGPRARDPAPRRGGAPTLPPLRRRDGGAGRRRPRRVPRRRLLGGAAAGQRRAAGRRRRAAQAGRGRHLHLGHLGAAHGGRRPRARVPHVDGPRLAYRTGAAQLRPRLRVGRAGPTGTDVAHGRAGTPDRDGERGRAGQARAARRARLLLVPRHGARGAPRHRPHDRRGRTGATDCPTTGWR